MANIMLMRMLVNLFNTRNTNLSFVWQCQILLLFLRKINKTMIEKIDFKQEELRYVFDSAQKRMEAHPELAAKYKKTIDNFIFYTDRDEAIKAATELNKKNLAPYQVWARVKKNKERYSIEDYYIVSNDYKILTAAEYIGMEQILSE